MGIICNREGENRNAYTFLLGKPGGKRSLGTPRQRRMNSIKMDGLVRPGSVEDSCECGNEPSGPMTCWEILEWQPLEKRSAP
jgi:hypothetical protein